MRSKVIIDGKALADFGAVFTDSMSYSAPNPQYETVEIVGRNGDLIVNKDRYSNYEYTLNGVIYENFRDNFLAMRAYLMNKNGYVRIEETELPNYYRTGRLMGGISPNTAGEHQTHTFTLRYWCKPELWLKSGEITIKQTAPFTIYNPTYYAAKPVIRVYGYGTLTIGTQTVVIAQGATEYIDIDSEIMDCYEGSVNRNSLVTMDAFPTLDSGANAIEWSGNISAVWITPRWYTL